MKVRVHWNRRKKLWSVLHKGRVVQRLPALVLFDCKFVVLRGGWLRFKREGVRNVHAFVEGHLCESPADIGDTHALASIPARYNLELGQFQTARGEALTAAFVIFQQNGRIFAISPHHS